MQITVQLEGTRPFTQDVTTKPKVGQILTIKTVQHYQGSDQQQKANYKITTVVSDGNAYIVQVEPYTGTLPGNPELVKSVATLTTCLMGVLVIVALFYDFNVRLPTYIQAQHPGASLEGYSFLSASRDCTSNRVFTINGKRYLACANPLVPGVFEKGL